MPERMTGGPVGFGFGFEGGRSWAEVRGSSVGFQDSVR